MELRARLIGRPLVVLLVNFHASMMDALKYVGSDDVSFQVSNYMVKGA